MADEITVGASVFTSDGKELGKVKKVEETAFQVDAPLQLDYWLETGLVANGDANRLELRIDKDSVGGYKMDRPFDHNAFQDKLPEGYDPHSVRDRQLGGTQLRP